MAYKKGWFFWAGCQLLIEVGDSGLMIARNMKALASPDSRAVDDILARPVIIIRFTVLHREAVIGQRPQVKIGCREVENTKAQVACDRQRFEENLRSSDGRAEIQENAPLQFGDRGREKLEIYPTGGTQGCEISFGVLVDDIRADGDMDGRRDAQAITHGKARLPAGMGRALDFQQ